MPLKLLALINEKETIQKNILDKYSDIRLNGRKLLLNKSSTIKLIINL